MRDSSQIPVEANTSSTPSTNLKRRRFLLAAAGGAGAVAAAAATPAQAAVAAAPGANAPDTSTGYRETEHVKAYYASIRS